MAAFTYEDEAADPELPIVAPTPYPSTQEPSVANAAGEPLAGVDFTYEDEAPEDPGRPVLPKPMFAWPNGPEIPAGPLRDNVLQPMVDMTTGFNEFLATSAGVPVEVMNDIWTLMDGEGFLDNPGDAKKEIVKHMKTVGLTADQQAAANEALAGFGNDLAQNFALLSIMFGAGKYSKLMNEMVRKPVTKAPVTSALGEVGATAGADLGSRYGPFGEIAGALIGSGAAATPAVLRGAGRAVGGSIGAAMGLPTVAFDAMTGGGVTGALTTTGAQMGRRGAEAVLRQGIMKEADPLLSKVPTLDTMTFAKEAIEGDITKADNTIRKAVNDFRTAADPAEASVKLRRSLVKAFRQGRKTEQGLWGKVNMRQQAQAVRLKDYATKIVRDTAVTAPENVPMDMIRRIWDLRDTTTLKELQGLRTVIGAQLREPQTNDALVRNLNLLDDAVLNVMVKANPTDKSLIEAREYSRWLHDHFSRGPVGAYIGRGMSDKVAMARGPEELAQALLPKELAGRQIAGIAENLDMPSLVQESSKLVRNTAQMLAQELGPEKGAKFLAQHGVQRFMKEFPKEYSEVKLMGAQLTDAIAQRKVIEKSAFKRFAEMDPQAAIRDLVYGPKKVARAKEIVARVRDDKDALEGLRNGVMGELLGASRGSFDTLKNMINSRDVKPMLYEVLGSKAFIRFNRAVTAGAEYSTTREGRKRSLLRNLYARFAGAGVARAAGAKTIQQTGAAAQFSERAISGLIDELPAEELFLRAMTDPKVERYLLAKSPTTLRELTQAKDLTRSVLAGIELGNQLTEQAPGVLETVQEYMGD